MPWWSYRAFYNLLNGGGQVNMGSLSKPIVHYEVFVPKTGTELQVFFEEFYHNLKLVLKL